MSELKRGSFRIQIFLPLILIALVILSTWITLANAKENKGSQDDRVLDSSLLKGKVIILDPGHGGQDTGTTAENLIEKQLNLEVALRLEKLLTQAGATVYLTRKDDREVSLEARVRFFHSLKADAIISLHHNAKPYDRAANEVSVYRPNFPTAEAKRLAIIVSQELVKKTGNPKGALGPVNYYILENSKSLPIVLAEPYFLTHEPHIKLLQKPQTLNLEAEAYFEALILFFDETYVVK